MMNRRILNRLILCVTLFGVASFARGDLANPGWYDEGAGVSDWHYRVPVVLPAQATTDSLVVLNVDFDVLLDQLGVASGSVNFDEASPRVVRPNGALAAQQEFTDSIYLGVLDGTGDAEGEVRFVQESGAGTYYLYFDITANGLKPVNPMNPVNGHFEQSNGGTPTSWVTSSINAGGGQSNAVQVTNPGATIDIPRDCSSNRANNADNGPNEIGGNATGRAWHLLGYRMSCEDGVGSERIRLSRDIAVPAGAAAGSLTWYFQLQTYDGITNTTNYDWIAFYVNGVLVNHSGLSIANGTNPQLQIENNRIGRNGFSRRMFDFGWKQATLDLTPFAGSTINFRIETRHSATDNAYREWLKIDDVEWSRQNATLGNAEGFGVNITAPGDTSVGPAARYTFGETLFIETVVDAAPVAVTADLYDSSGTLVTSGIPLFDDGSHGDAVAGDDRWTNDGSVGAEPTRTFVATDLAGTQWLVRVFAPDGSVSGIGAPAGLLHRLGQPAAVVQANFFNVDEQIFTLGGAVITMTKTVIAVEDPGSGTISPKSIPGARLRYDVQVANAGPDAADADSIVLTDELPAQVSLCVLAACADGGAPFVFDDATSPDPTGLTFAFPADVSYSLDGTNWTYNPVPDGGGFDPLVRFVRLEPDGAFNGPGLNGSPEFSVSYFVRVD